MKINLNIVFLILLSSLYCQSQNSRQDSLLNVVKISKNDTAKVNALNELFLEFEFSDEKKAKGYLDEAIEYCNAINYKNGLANTYIYSGYFYEDKSDFSTALNSYRSALNRYSKLKNKKGVGDCYDNIGNIFYDQGNYPEALSNYFLGLKLREETENYDGIAESYSNLGNVYSRQNNFNESLIYINKSLEIRKKIKDISGVSDSYGNLGIAYCSHGDYSLALKYYFMSLKLKKELEDAHGIATIYINIGVAYNDLSRIEKNRDSSNIHLELSLVNYKESLKLFESTEDFASAAACKTNIGIALIRQKKFKEAEGYLINSLTALKQIGFKEYIRDTYHAFSELDSARGDFEKAFKYQKLWVLYSDSIDNEETRKKTIQSQMNYDFDKKEAVAQAEHKKELENQELISEEKSRKQRLVLLLVSCFLFIVIVFSGFVFRSLRITRKQKEIIELQKILVEEQKLEVELQKHKVEEHQREIIDSITYAMRIQRALLPTEKYIEKNMNRLRKS